MADERLYSTSDITILLHNETSPRSSQVLDSPIIPNSTSFLGENNEDESFDGFWLQSGKKRRLSVDQVQFLEKNFEIDNKLEPERKIQLAKELGLQPRQVAIWFQNRRARFKTKQLEKDYTSLKTTYDNLKSDYQNLLTQKDKLKTEVRNLKQKLAIPEKGKQQEEASSAKSVVFDSSDNLNSSMADSSRGFEPDLQSDCFSQDEQQNLRFPKLETCYYDDDPTQGCCNLIGFQIEDQALAFWPY